MSSISFSLLNQPNVSFLELRRGREMERRRTERERETESDTRDRQKEKEELEELKTKIFSEGHSDPTATLKQVREGKLKVSRTLDVKPFGNFPRLFTKGNNSTSLRYSCQHLLSVMPPALSLPWTCLYHHNHRTWKISS